MRTAVSPRPWNLDHQATLSTRPDTEASGPSKGTAEPQHPMLEQHKPQERQASRESVRVGRNGVGAGLRRMLDDVTQEPVPDQWLALLRRADDLQRIHFHGNRQASFDVLKSE